MYRSITDTIHIFLGQFERTQAFDAQRQPCWASRLQTIALCTTETLHAREINQLSAQTIKYHAHNQTDLHRTIQYILLMRKAKQQTNNPLGHASDNKDTAHQRNFTWGNCHHWYRLDHTTTSQRNLLQRSRKLHYQKVDDHSATFLLQLCQTIGINKKNMFPYIPLI